MYGDVFSDALFVKKRKVKMGFSSRRVAGRCGSALIGGSSAVMVAVEAHARMIIRCSRFGPLITVKVDLTGRAEFRCLRALG
ncbi:hypothetical protein [Sphingomonas sp.]|uniref:hypothetical protein n=1 Tax=Sphingomonas sp. TaxID=28214 RepID=UPI0025FF3D57|nr:hypothetical protein [Sphingomonas sp.]